jgi:hypothetical protein
MAFSNEEHRRRYAEDPEYRARKLAENRAWRTEHREKLNAQWFERWTTDAEFREGRRARYRLKTYGLGADDYQRMLAEQNGVCAVCKLNSRRELYVDHCHATRKVRGLLCNKCNTGIGMFDDDPDRMRAGAAYVERARGVVGARGAERPDAAAVMPGPSDQYHGRTGSIDARLQSYGRRRMSPPPA